MRELISLFLTMTLLLGSAVAQTGDWAAVQALTPGADIWVKTAPGRKLQGRLDSVSIDRLTLWSEERDFPGRKVVRRELFRGEVKQVRLNHRAASILAGAAVGAGVGVGIGVVIDSRSESNEDRGTASVVFGLLGGALGAGIAKSHPFLTGKTIYLAP